VKPGKVLGFVYIRLNSSAMAARIAAMMVIQLMTVKI